MWEFADNSRLVWGGKGEFGYFTVVNMSLNESLQSPVPEFASNSTRKAPLHLEIARQKDLFKPGLPQATGITTTSKC